MQLQFYSFPWQRHVVIRNSHLRIEIYMKCSGPVKELNTVRKVYMEDGNEVDNTWYDDAQWSTRFDENGFVTYFAEYDVTYDEAYKSCVYHMEGENQNGKFYSTYEFSLDTIQNGIKLNGEWNGTNGGGLYQIECCFDAQRRPTIMHRSVDDVFLLPCRLVIREPIFIRERKSFHLRWSVR